MSKLLSLAIIVSSLLFVTCSKDTEEKDDTCECITLPWFSGTTTRSTTTSLKGFMLYSWKNNQNTWNYSIVPNLNATPAHEMVGPDNTVTGEECLKKNLYYFAEGEEVYWEGTGDLQIPEGDKVTLSFPPDYITNDIETFCDSINIEIELMI